MERKALSALIAWQNQKSRKPLVIQGARQVDKTYLIKEFGKRYFKKFHYINFEDTPDSSVMFRNSLKPEDIIRKWSF